MSKKQNRSRVDFVAAIRKIKFSEKILENRKRTEIIKVLKLKPTSIIFELHFYSTLLLNPVQDDMEVVYDEIESLEAILMDDVKIVKDFETGFPKSITTTIFPTVGGDSERQYVYLTLQVLPLKGYPDQSPDYKLLTSRGLDDSKLLQINEACRKKLRDSIGFPVVFDLIEIIREHLTSSNVPSGQCVICLYGFQEGDDFIKTECYHHYHCYCLRRHLKATKAIFLEEQDKLPAWQKKLANPFQALCPVCREVIKEDIPGLEAVNMPTQLQNASDFFLTDQLKELQSRMQKLFIRQKLCGGVIEEHADDNNILVTHAEENAVSPHQEPEESKAADVHQSKEKMFKDTNAHRNNHQNRKANYAQNKNDNSTHPTRSSDKNYVHYHERRSHHSQYRHRRYQQNRQPTSKTTDCQQLSSDEAASSNTR